MGILILMMSMGIINGYGHENGLIKSYKRYLASAGYRYAPVGARPIAMGEAFSAIANDVYTMFYNPGGLAFVKKEIFVWETSDIPILNGYWRKHYLGYTFNIKNKCGIGLSYSYGNDWEIMNISLGVPVYRVIGIGIAYKFSHDFYAIDIGMLFREPLGRVSVAFGFNNLAKEDYAMVWLSYIGIAFSIPNDRKPKYTFASDIVVPKLEFSRLYEGGGISFRNIAFQIGVEYKVTKKWYLRAGLVGYKNRTACGIENYYIAEKEKLPPSEQLLFSVPSYHGGGLGIGVVPYKEVQIDFTWRGMVGGPDCRQYILSINIIL